jgi:hypothetical protein
VTHFTPFSWLTLALFAGTLAGIGQVIAKFPGQHGMTPYVLIGTIGLVWAMCSIAMVLGGNFIHRQGGPEIMTVQQIFQLAPLVILAAIAAALLFWIENLARFDAINKAPYITMVLVVIEISAGIAALAGDIIYQLVMRGKLMPINRYYVLGILFAVATIVMFRLGHKQAEQA